MTSAQAQKVKGKVTRSRDVSAGVKVGRESCTNAKAEYSSSVVPPDPSVHFYHCVSADKNAITRQCMVISTSILVGIIDVGVDECGILSRSVGQTNGK